VAVHIYTQTIHRTTQITTNVEECGPCHVFAIFTLAFGLQVSKKHGKTSTRVRKTSVSVQYTYYQNSTHITKTVHILPKQHTYYQNNIHITKTVHILPKQYTYYQNSIHFTKTIYILPKQYTYYQNRLKIPGTLH
jgi:hypothetical protein